MFKILIVDDSKTIHAFAKHLLSKSKEVCTESAMDGEQAIQLLEKDPSFDLILLDWEMPVLNGPETLKKLKSIGCKVPVVMMTTKDKPEEIAEMLALGAAEYLMKPFTVDILFEKIEFATSQRLSYAA